MTGLFTWDKAKRRNGEMGGNGDFPTYSQFCSGPFPSPLTVKRELSLDFFWVHVHYILLRLLESKAIAMEGKNKSGNRLLYWGVFRFLLPFPNCLLLLLVWYPKILVFVYVISERSWMMPQNLYIVLLICLVNTSFWCDHIVLGLSFCFLVFYYFLFMYFFSLLFIYNYFVFFFNI